MRQGTYLNAILSVNALLLTGLLWSNVADQAVLADSAHAQTRRTESSDDYVMPNASGQRQKIIEELQALRKTVASTNELLQSNKLEVVVTNMDELTVEVVEARP